MPPRLAAASALEPARSLFVIVPACDEEQSLPQVLEQLRAAHRSAQVLVVDDGSSDGTARVAAAAGVTVIEHGGNRGYGAALTTGYKAATIAACTFVAQLDADGQHDPAQLDRLLLPLERGEADVVVGSRMLDGGGHETTLPRLLGIRFFSWLGQLLLGRPVTDATSGFWAMNRAALDFLVEHTPADYPDLNILIALEAAGLRVKEVPVHMSSRQGGVSHMRGLRPFVYVPQMLVSVAREYLTLRAKRRDTLGPRPGPGTRGST